MPTLMVSVSGIRGIVGDGLDPNTIVKYTSAYADFCGEGKIVVGRDTRITGEMVKDIVIGTLLAKGNDVIDIGICPTPTVLFNIKKLNAVGAIAITASHNPNEWNALKLLNSDGEFMTPEENVRMLKLLDTSTQNYKNWEHIGKLKLYSEGLQNHFDEVLKLKYIDLPVLRKRKFKVLLDCVNGAGNIVMPKLLTELGCEVIALNCDESGIFPRLPEPFPENLKDVMKSVKELKADIGIVLDPDADRLVFITEEGEPLGEENSVTNVVKFILSKNRGNVVVNLSTTRGIDDVAGKFGCQVFRTPVGEAYVVKKMKEVNAIVGGEGSGGVIVPELQYARDALVGAVLTLQHLLEFGGKTSEFRSSLPQYFNKKIKVNILKKNPNEIINKLIENYKNQNINIDDGLRIDFEDHWVHMRKSNTEPIIRCVVEVNDKYKLDKYAEKYHSEIISLC
ncbi:MAG: phosphoglucosamine mutase [Ignavibacteriales bacterium]|nr:phosphoglucosamine mutase [Ignavibacteriales bacterium]